MSEHVVAQAGELDDGDRIVVQLEGQEVGVFKLDGEYHAYSNWCVHQSGPACEGPIGGTRNATYDPDEQQVEEEWVKQGEILRCPWHYWEYDLRTGECLSDEDICLPSYPVRVEDGNVVVSLE